MDTTVNDKTLSIDGDRMYLCSLMFLNERRRKKSKRRIKDDRSKSRRYNERESVEKKNVSIFKCSKLNLSITIITQSSFDNKDE